MPKKKVEETIYKALDQGPVYGIGLVRDHGFSPVSVHAVLSEWKDRRWVAACRPPEDAESGRDSVWYSITLAGQQELAKKFC